jgi:hypothetical protein
MKKVILFAVVVLCAQPVWALRFMGPPTTDIRGGQFGLGLDWSHSQFDIRSNDLDLDTAANVEANVYFTRLLFGIADGAEISGLVGLSDIEESEEDGLRSTNDVTWGAGLKLNFIESGSFGLGAAFQFTSLEGDDETAVGPFIAEGDLDAYLLELAVGASYKLHHVSLYGGPFVHFITGDFEGRVAGLREVIDVEQEESKLGGYVGVSAELAADTSVSLEYQFTDDSYGIGVGIVHRFGNANRPSARAASQETPSWPTSVIPIRPKEDTVRERLKVDASGEPVKDKDGNFIFEPVNERAQGK